jgi:hypothetical protein
MKNRTYLLWSGLAIIGLNLFPLYQAVHDKGYLHYSNAFDETTYLQYDFSLRAQTITRAGQYLVTFAHEAGLSGGWINLLLDLCCLAGFLALTRAIFVALGYNKAKSNEASFLLLVLPFLANGANPVVSWIFHASLESGAIRWLAAPEGPFSPLVRSPEPQLSILLLCLATLIALRTRNYAFVFVCLPFLYPFVAGPAAFIVIALFLKQRCFKSDIPYWIPWLLSFVGTCLIALAPLQLHRFGLLPVQMRATMESRWPLLSLSFLYAFLLVLILSSKNLAKRDFFLKTAALTPLALANTQLVTGFIAEPTNMEQYIGVYCVAVALVFPLIRKGFPKWLKVGVVALGVWCMMRSTENYFLDNLQQEEEFPLNDRTLEALRTDSANAAINDITISGTASMLFPKQPATLFNAANDLTPTTLPHYLCASKLIVMDPEYRARYVEIVRRMDHEYQYGGLDFILLRQGRDIAPKAVNYPSTTAGDCGPMSIKYLPIEEGVNRKQGPFYTEW